MKVTDTESRLTLSEGLPRPIMGWLRVLIIVAVLIGICVLAWMLGAVANHLRNILTCILELFFLPTSFFRRFVC